MENLASSGTPVVASQGKVKAFFDQWRQNKRAQQQGEADTPSKTADSPKVEAGSPSKTPAPKVDETSSSDVVGRGSPASVRVMARSAQVVEGAGAPAGVTTSALKLISQPETSSSPTNENGTRDNDDATPSKKRRRDDTDTEPEDSHPVRSNIVGDWNPPFKTTPRYTRPTTGPNSARRRGLTPRRASPAPNTHGEDQDQAQDQAQDQGEEQEQGEDQGEENGAEADGKEEQPKAKPEHPREKRYSFKSIEAHRPSPDEPNLFELLVHWTHAADGPSETWEAEVDLHFDAPRSLFSYWRAVGGRESHMRDPGLWYVAGIKSHKVARGRVTMLVSWVGSGDNNWEPEDKLDEVAPEVLEEYWRAKGGREACVGAAVKKPGAGRKGRPKKARRT